MILFLRCQKLAWFAQIRKILNTTSPESMKTRMLYWGRSSSSAMLIVVQIPLVWVDLCPTASSFPSHLRGLVLKRSAVPHLSLYCGFSRLHIIQKDQSCFCRASLSFLSFIFSCWGCFSISVISSLNLICISKLLIIPIACRVSAFQKRSLKLTPFIEVSVSLPWNLELWRQVLFCP